MARHIYTPEQVDFMRVEYQQHSRRELTLLVNKKYSLSQSSDSVMHCLKKHAIKSNRKDRHIPVSGFKPGNTFAKTSSVLSERTDKRDGRVKIKVKITHENGAVEHKWISKSVYLWEEKNGPLPPGMIIRFLDGNNHNFDDSNMLPVTRALNIYLAKIGHADLPAELRPIALTNAQLTLKTIQTIKIIEAEMQELVCHEQ